MREGRKQTRNSISAVSRLLDADPFARPKGDAELEELVAETARRSSEPYRDLLQLLMGAASDLQEEGAKALWQDAVAHRKALHEQLGRQVALRVAMLDLISQHPERAHERRAPVIVSRGVLTDVLSSVVRDELTGLLRRDQFVTILEYELTQRFRRPPIVCYLDLDGFKQINDDLGHARGDEVLATFGAVLRRSARRGDVFARLGGDEFAGLLVECSLDAARRILQRVRNDFVSACEGLQVDVSVGLVSARTAEDPSSLLERADRAMYKEKFRKRAQSRRASPDRRPLALYYGSRVEPYLELSTHLAGLGCPLLPAMRGEVLEQLLAVAGPRGRRALSASGPALAGDAARPAARRGRAERGRRRRGDPCAAPSALIASLDAAVAPARRAQASAAARAARSSRGAGARPSGRSRGGERATGADAAQPGRAP